ncbi:glycosyltransferase family 10 domain-containing protein [Pandoraea terrigena]|uniref:Alpha-(1,3)-fucosyltransferase FucT n=1 Tax=Pandoraea terrigena TaxID=2508292 RepID=A0A5E4VSB5_9BURK|nr:glycosyltransferase family 10 [Pandoraea terrigena]VVE14873.1 Alpha-(1,3)-fucosyltransferase FucT [Pandoraea terrigena]
MAQFFPEHAVFIDPSSEHFLGDRLFDASNAFLNRDGTLEPFVRLREQLMARGIPVHTADALREGRVVAKQNHYWSMGLLNGYQPLQGRDDVRLRGFFLFEPPLVAPKMYAALPELSQQFESVLLHNTIGDGYSLRGVDTDKLEKLDWPQPYESEVPSAWSRTSRQNKLVVIAGNHNPRFRRPEFYSKRIEAVAQLGKRGAIDLYGRGWDRRWSRQSAWLPYWRHYRALMQVYRGSCESKFDVLANYRFSLCFENMPMTGYLTEKIFDCLYAGTVPVYWGAPDVDSLVPAEAFVDMRDYAGYDEVCDAVLSMSDGRWQEMREAGRQFLRTSGRARYFNSLLHTCGQL